MSISSDQPLLSNQLPESLDFTFDNDPIQSMGLYLKRTANILNTKQGGIYLPIENANFNQFFTPNEPFVLRNGYRKLFDMVALNGGPLAPGANYSFPHGIMGITMFTRIYGTATNSDTPVSYLPLPYVPDAPNRGITIWFDPTDVNISIGSTQTALTQCYIIGEYLKT